MPETFVSNIPTTRGKPKCGCLAAYPSRASTTSAMVFLLAFTGGGRGNNDGDHISKGLPRIDRGGYMNS